MNASHIILISDSATNLILGDSRYLGPYVLAESLRRSGFKVTVIDFFLRIPNFFEYINQFINEDTLFIGVSSTFLTTTPDLNKLEDPGYVKTLTELALSKFGSFREEQKHKYNKPGIFFNDSEELKNWSQNLKEILIKKNPKGKIIIGGSKTSLYLEGKGLEKFDYIFLSDARNSILKFAQLLQNNEAIPTTQLNNINIFLTDEKNIVENDIYKISYAKQDSIQFRESLPLEISKGCIFNCKFCHYDKKESIKKHLNILRDELVENFEKYETTVYHFCDDCFNDSLKKVEEVCNLILGLPFKMEWVSYARLDLAISRPDTLDLMIESGARGLFFGIESFCNEALARTGKKVAPERIKEFLIKAKAKHHHNCFFEGSFIIGLPGESKESIRSTIKWLIENDALDFVNAAPLYIHRYNKEFDKKSIDYADFSRNPGKYNLEINESDLSWKHSQMNSKEASALTNEFMSLWSRSGHNTIFKNIFDYPTLRTLGYSKDEIWLMGKNEDIALDKGVEAHEKFQSFLKKYHETLLRTK